MPAMTSSTPPAATALPWPSTTSRPRAIATSPTYTARPCPAALSGCAACAAARLGRHIRIIEIRDAGYIEEAGSAAAESCWPDGSYPPRWWPETISRPSSFSIDDLAAISMIASLPVAVLTNTWPFFVFRDLWPSGRFFYGVIFLLMSLGIIVPVLAAGVFAPDHVVIFIEWWEIALFAVFWGLEIRRVARLRDNKVEKPDPNSAAHSGSPTAPRSASSPSRRSKRENRRARIRRQPGPNGLANYHKCLDMKPAKRVNAALSLSL